MQEILQEAVGGIEKGSHFLWASLVVQTVKNLLAIRETQVRSLDQENPLEKRREWQPTLVFLPGEILWTEEPEELQFMVLQ